MISTNKKGKPEYKQKYDISRHHAWAASVLLAILIAGKGFLELSDIDMNDNIIVITGLILITYTLIAVFFTYKYRSALNTEKKVVEILHEDSIADLDKEKQKLEKKKAKNELKKEKKAKKNI